MAGRGLAAGLLLYAGVAPAVQVTQADVTHAKGRYSVRFDIRLDAPAHKLKPHLTDYANYSKHAQSIVESTVLGRTAGGATRLRLRLRSCVLLFCRTATVVKDITEGRDGVIRARIDPALSDFRESTEQWQLTEDGSYARLQYQAELTPTFFIPPLIGPWMLKREMRRLLTDNAAKFEALARE